MLSFEPFFPQKSSPKLLSSFKVSFAVSTTKDMNLLTELTHQCEL